MNKPKIRINPKKRRFYNAVIIENPVLVQGLNLVFVIAIGVGLKNAAVISFQIFCIHTVTMLLAMITVRLFPQWQRIVVNVAVSTVMMVVSRELASIVIPDILDSAGIYLSLTAINGMTLLQAGNVSARSKLWPVMTTAVYSSLAFAVVMVLVSAFREYFAGGTLWGIALPVPLKLSGISMPFFGFIFTGFLLAFAKFITRKLHAFQIAEAIRKAKPYIEVQN